MDNNIDDFFQGKIKLFQPSYKATSDAVLLGSSVKAKSGSKILDVGCGNGAISIIAKYHNNDCEVFGIDINEQEIENAKKSAKINGLDVNFLNFDIKTNPLKNESFDFVVTNPPYFKEGTLSKGDTKKLAHHERDISLQEWLNFCVRRVCYRGFISIIIDIVRIPEVISILNEKCGAIRLFPLYSKENDICKRAIVKARKESKEPFSIAKGLILHNEDGSYTENANEILRNAKILEI